MTRPAPYRGGNIPKGEGEKVRRNKPLVQPHKLALHHDRPVPPMPNTFPWTEAGIDYWNKVWQSPMGILYIDADIPIIERACVLHELVNAMEVKAVVLAELRHIEDRLGMSPLARRHLQWDIDRALNQQQETESNTKQDDDRFLRVVSD